MKAVEHKRMPPCRHEGETWGQAVTRAMKCADLVINIPDMSIVIAAMKAGEYASHHGQIFRPGRAS